MQLENSVIAFDLENIAKLLEREAKEAEREKQVGRSPAS